MALAVVWAVVSPDDTQASACGPRAGKAARRLTGRGCVCAWTTEWLRVGGAAHRAKDWTDGCIAVTNQEIDEIWGAVKDGTPLEIRP